ncbi:uncharacterized protein [Aegilops tauschii subsp. strangulata]|uniref:uncharacterized protein n=1 Tax=Aegilops tauschii subsp. strangulata TaxID=200361 RepID=UPI00098B0E13|nr:uncharacterized protein LOC109764685 [Aegilops tauschii subsp. strangulata]
MAATESESVACDEELQQMMRQLGIEDSDLIDIVYEDACPEPVKESIRWLAIGRVHTSKEFGDFWFYKNMRSTWDLAQDVKFRSLGDKLYTMQFSCLGDWDKVMEGGPWSFRGNPVLMAPYDGFTKPSSIDLCKFKIWMQIQDLPDGFEPLVQSLARTVGEFCSLDNRGRDVAGNFYRVRIILDVRNKLKNHVSVVRKRKRQIFKVKYERLPDWCAVCGMIGHLHT